MGKAALKSALNNGSAKENTVVRAGPVCTVEYVHAGDAPAVDTGTRVEALEEWEVVNRIVERKRHKHGKTWSHSSDGLGKLESECKEKVEKRQAKQIITSTVATISVIKT